MKKLPHILILYSLTLLSCEPERQYTKNTCHRTYFGQRFTTDAERAEHSECTLSRLEVYDVATKEHIAHIAYNSRECHISYLLVDKKYRNMGIGTDLAHRALQDMRANYNCKDISFFSARSAEKFWEKLGAKPNDDYMHVFPDPTSEDSSKTLEKIIHFYT